MKKDNKIDFCIIGLQKTGTTSLNIMLEQHPNISMCRPKEMNYFGTDIIRETEQQGLTNNRGEQIYKIQTEKDLPKAFSHAKDNDLIGDCTPIYIDSKKAFENIRKYNPMMKIIFIDRDTNTYLRELIKMYDEKNQWDYLAKTLSDIRHRANYKFRLIDYKCVFHTLIINYEEFNKDNIGTCNKIFKFLGVEPFNVKELRLNTKNIGSYGKQPITKRAKEFVLKKIYKS